MNHSFLNRYWLSSLAVIAMLAWPPSALAAPSSATAMAKDDAYFAIVDGQRIAMSEYEMALGAGLRKRFYHGKVPQDKLDAFRREIADTLVDRVLLLKEAQRRGLRPDATEIERQLAQYQKRYQGTPTWQAHKDEALAGLRLALEQEALLRLLERQVRDVPAPREDAVKAYYREHPKLFTTPEAFRISLIVLKVAPSSTPDVWEAAYEEARNLVERLRMGADFAQLARIHSGDESAINGGDMGFVHKGMLAEPVQQVVEQLTPGEVSSPVMVLQGVAVLRLEERRAPMLNDFVQVAERATQLLMRQRSDDAWRTLGERLRRNAEIVLNPEAMTGDIEMGANVEARLNNR